MKISAIMVTGRRLGRQALARVAVKCFLAQTISERELVIVNDGIPLFPDGAPSGVREIRIPFSRARTLGELRNIGLDHAHGDLVIQWDDDDWHHPERIMRQAREWRTGCAVLLRRQYRYNLLTGHAIIHDAPVGIHGTILHARVGAGRYLSLRKQEDTLFLKNFATKIVVDGPPSLYVRLFHGANTWDEAHVMGQSPLVSKLCYPLTDKMDKEFLKNIIIGDYRELF